MGQQNIDGVGGEPLCQTAATRRDILRIDLVPLVSGTQNLAAIHDLELGDPGQHGDSCLLPVFRVRNHAALVAFARAGPYEDLQSARSEEHTSELQSLR